MLARKPEYLSEHLAATRNRLADFRHGGIYLNDEELESFIKRFDQFTDMARALEAEINCHEWNGHARRDPKIIAAFDIATGGNIVAFPRRTPDHRPTGGSAA